MNIAKELYDLIKGNTIFSAASEIVFPKTSGKGVRVDATAPGFGWKDLTGTIHDRGNAQAPTLSSWLATVNGTIYQYMFKTASGYQEVFNEYHIPHDWLPLAGAASPNEKAAYIHSHWSVIASPTGIVNWLFDITYAKGYDQAAFSNPITVGITQTAQGNLLEHQIAEVQFAAPGGVIASAVNVSITSGQATLTAASALFSSADIGKTVRITGAGSAGADLDTHISGYTSSTQVTLAANAGTTVSVQPNFKWRIIDSDLIEVDGLIIVRTWRDSGRTADTLDVSPFLHFVDIHYQSTQLATKTKNYPFYT